MDIQPVGFENHMQHIGNEEKLPNRNIQAQLTIVQTMQQVKQQMQGDPSYQPTFQEKTILNAIEAVNTKLAGQDTRLEVDFHDKTKEMIIRLVDKQSKDVIREIPSEKMIDMIVSLCEIAGLYIDEKR